MGFEELRSEESKKPFSFFFPSAIWTKITGRENPTTPQFIYYVGFSYQLKERRRKKEDKLAHDLKNSLGKHKGQNSLRGWVCYVIFCYEFTQTAPIHHVITSCWKITPPPTLSLNLFFPLYL